MRTGEHKGQRSSEFKVFICYVRDTGGDFASHLKSSLKRREIPAFLDTEDIPKIFKGTEKWWEHRDQAIRDSEIFLFIITAGVETSSEVRKEINLALNENKPIMCLLHHDLKPNIVIDLKDKRLNLEIFNQIAFETKEDLVRKVVINVGEERPKAPSHEKYPHRFPVIDFRITQSVRNNPLIRREFPSIGFNISNPNDYPLRAKVEARPILGGKDLGLLEDSKGYYTGEELWNLNPRKTIFGNFSVPKKCVDSTEDLKIEVRVTAIDQYGRSYAYLPQCWSYVRKHNYWFLEPRSFVKWT